MPIWDAFYAVAEPIITLISTLVTESFGLAFDGLGIAWQLLVDLLSALERNSSTAYRHFHWLV